MPPTLLARQPVYDRNLRLFGYELLFRHDDVTDEARVVDGDQASSDVILGAFVRREFDRVVHGMQAFVNVTPNLILDGSLRALPKDRVIFEILEDVVPDAALIDAVRALVHDGWRFALDDFTWRPEIEPIVPLADIVKLDVVALGDGLEAEVRRLRPYRTRLLAEKIETLEVLERCQDLGFSYFQGYFLSRPRLVSAPLIDFEKKPDGER